MSLCGVRSLTTAVCLDVQRRRWPRRRRRRRRCDACHQKVYVRNQHI